jgi:hypothetical protein
MNASRGLILLFGLASAALAGGVAIELQPSPQATQTLRSDRAAPANATVAKAGPMPRADNVRSYDVISDRPLFSESRRPPERLPEDEAGPTADTLRHINLTGVIITPARKTALLYSQHSPDTINLQEGQSIEGWRLDKVLHDRIVLSHDGETTEINIWDLTRPRPPRRQPPAPARPAKERAAKAAPSKDAPGKAAPAKRKPPAARLRPAEPADVDAGEGKGSEERVVRKTSDPDR